MRTLCLLAALSANAWAQTPLVKGVGNFIHAVANLDESVKFYRDVLGMELQRPPGAWQSTEQIAKMYDAAGAEFRVASAQVPGVAMRVELVEFRGVNRKTVRREYGEPGAAYLILLVADIQPIVERIRAAKVNEVVKLNRNCDGQGLVVADPDGFLVAIAQKRDAAKPAAAGNFTGLSFAVATTGVRAWDPPLKALGLQAVKVIYPCQPVEQVMIGPDIPYTVSLPDGFRLLLVGNDGPVGTPSKPRDPGSAVLRLLVTDAEAAVKALGDAGTTVASDGGAIQTLPPAGLKATILRGPENLFIQVVQ